MKTLNVTMPMSAARRGISFLPAAGALLLAAMLSACSGAVGDAADDTASTGTPTGGSTAGGTTTGGSTTGGAGGTSGGTSGGSGLEPFFAAKVQPQLGFCRSCHVPGGVADVEDGHDFMLSSTPSEDLANFKASWERLGRNNPTSRILLMASGQETPHAGGAPWPKAGPAYAAVETVFKCFADPAACASLIGGGGGTSPLPQAPLLGSARGGHVWFDYCAGKPDSAALPADPRSLVQPGISDGRAVHFNAFWKDCHADPQLVGEAAHPANCGELRSRLAQGSALMTGNGQSTSGSFFAGNTHSSSALGISAESYRRLWMLWGMPGRPANFDELAAQRYGMPIGKSRNPYPLEGEDPNATDGGSGQLSAYMTQLRTPEGEWTGQLGFTCHACHSGAAGLPSEGPELGLLYGSGNSLQDIALMAREIGESGTSPGVAFSLFGTSRGTNNASDVNVFFAVTQDDYAARLNQHALDIFMTGSTGSGDTPAWWNMGHRPLKFQDGFFAGDAVRVDLIFYMPIFDSDQERAKNWVREQAPNADLWMTSLKSPAYPLPVDTALAEQGAVLFHNKNLWAANLQNPVPKPAGGNGSCASCHGAYSPRYVRDAAFLADPSMEGIAAYIVPKDIIRTDPARVDTNDDIVNDYGSTSFLGYPETAGTAQDCGPQNRPALRGEREFGYLAPPLYGVWATAPYLHNGSVPDAWSLLKSSERPTLWRRVSAPRPAGQETTPGIVMGYDTSLARAYAPDRLGWKYDAIACGSGTTSIPLLDCSPVEGVESPVQLVLAQLYGNVLAAWNLGQAGALLQLSPQQVEDRKVYNTQLYSQGNEGHDFADVLTDAERRALIEYLKTL